MRNLLAILLLTIALPAAAAERPGNLQPAPDLPPPPEFSLDPALQEQITIIKRGTDTVEEHRIGGKLFMLKVTPATGAPYYLIDEKGDGKTTPEELLAGSHAVCFAMVLTNTITKQGGKVRKLKVTATVTAELSDTTRVGTLAGTQRARMSRKAPASDAARISQVQALTSPGRG